MRKKIKYILLFLFAISIFNPLHSSITVFNKTEEKNSHQDTVTINKARLAAVVSGTSIAYVGSMAYLQYVWYKDSEHVPFQFYNDFRGYNQIDKFGHAYGSYLESYIGFHSLLWAGVPRKKAAIYGGCLGFMLQLPIEIWDGMYEGWGFSWTDLGANALGSLIVVGQELAFQEQIVKFKFSFNPSPYARQANGYLGSGFDELLYDYNGHTYWFSIGIDRLIKNENIPQWVNFAIGYSAGGMFGEFENKHAYQGVIIPETERYRQFLFSLDIDFTRIPVKNKALKKLFNCMFLIKIPFPAIEINTKGELRFHPLYI
jgi:hypothetical protein